MRLAQAILKELAPKLSTKQFERSSAGEVPWDYRETARYGDTTCGFVYSQRCEAFDTSAGSKETIDISAKSYGLPEGQAFAVSYFVTYNSASGGSLALEIVANSASVGAVETQLRAIFSVQHVRGN
ncbi:MAG: hypothetical protein ACT4NL_15850 [Pseudomarimonas sp.]